MQLVSYLVLGLSWVNRVLDEYVVNLGFDEGCRRLARGGRLMSRLQNGRVQNYLRVIGVALVVLVLFLIWGCRAMNDFPLITLLTFVPLVGGDGGRWLGRGEAEAGARGWRLASACSSLALALVLVEQFQRRFGRISIRGTATPGFRRWASIITSAWTGSGLLMVLLTAHRRCRWRCWRRGSDRWRVKQRSRSTSALVLFLASRACSARSRR